MIAALTTLLALCANAQVLVQTVNAENTGYIEGNLDLPLEYSFDRTVKMSSTGSYAAAGMTGGAMGGGMTGTGTGTNISTSRVSIGDKSILVSTSTKLYAYEKSKGRLNWQYPSENDMENGITGVPCAYEGKVYFATSKVLYSLDEDDGSVLKMRNIPTSAISMLTVYNGVLYFQAGDGKIYRLDPDTLDEAAPALSAEKAVLANGFTVSGDTLLSKSSNNVIYAFDLGSGQNIFKIDVDGVIRGYMPIILEGYIVVITDKSIIVYTPTGKEHTAQKFTHSIVCPPVTDGNNIYVACANQNIYSLRFTKSRMEQNWKKPFNMGQTISQLIALQDNALLCACKSGFIFALDLETGSICWSCQSGRVANNSTVSIPGYTPASAGSMGTGMTGMGMTGMTGTAGMSVSSQPITTKIVDGIEEVELSAILKNYSKSFVHEGIVGNAVYNAGTLAYMTDGGTLQVRSNVNASDKKAPEVLNYYPGYDSNSKKISAIPPITFKISVTDKGSGVDFKSAKLIVKDSAGNEYDVKMVYDLDNQYFYGVLSKPKTAVVVPFPTGTAVADFIIKDYAGNENNFEFSFELDSGLQPVKTIPDTSLKYLDVETGAVYGGQLNKLIRDAEATGAKKGGAVSSAATATDNNNSGSSISAASVVSAASSSGASDPGNIDGPANDVQYDNGVNNDIIVLDDEDDSSLLDSYPAEGFPPFPPF
ncbi:MAG: PQQ-binding-like beta-propeller repeat protein [Abditibacteriota bacterium]|nr:PQQ-binding-like beta-propeller repeat protein [Abditibacteriota bacterium]